MSDQNVQYELSLKDVLSPSLDKADEHAHKLEHTMHGLGERVAHVAEAFGISFAMYRGLEFIKSGTEEMEKLHEAEAGLQNSMENMGTYTKEAFDKMVDSSDELSHHMNFTQGEVLELQSQLGLVGHIGQDAMNRLTKVSADLAVKMGMSLRDAGDLLARGINSPEMARRLGMALKIDPGIMMHVQNLAKQGKDAQARMELLAIAESKVGGAAAAAFNADPLSKFNKTMLDLKEEAGAAAMTMLQALAPALEWVASHLKSAAAWAKTHIGMLEALAIAVGTLVVAYKSYQIMAGLVTAATELWAAAQTALNFVMNLSPLGWVITAIAAIAAAVIYCYEHFTKFRAIIMGVWQVMKDIASWIKDIFVTTMKGLGELIHGALHFDLGEMKQGLSDATAVFHSGGVDIAKSFKKGYDDTMAEASDQDKHKSLLPAGKKFVPAKFASDKVAAEPKTKATGSKSVTINVTIQKLGETHMNVTNVKEGMTKLKEAIVATLTGAVNDFQVVAEH